MSKCVILGSFRKHYKDILTVIESFKQVGIKVLSPAASRVANPGEEFAVLQSDLTSWPRIEVRRIEDRVLGRLEQCDFVYVCNPNRYIGLTVAFEVGYAKAKGIPVFSMYPINDVTLGQYVDRVMPVEETIDFIVGRNCRASNKKDAQC